MAEQPIGWLTLTDTDGCVLYVDALAVVSVRAARSPGLGASLRLRWTTELLEVREDVETIMNGIVYAQRGSSYRNGI